jgi:hypothetical protein
MGFEKSFGLDQENIILDTLWGVLIGKEFKNFLKGTNLLLAWMFLFSNYWTIENYLFSEVTKITKFSFSFIKLHIG